MNTLLSTQVLYDTTTCTTSQVVCVAQKRLLLVKCMTVCLSPLLGVYASKLIYYSVFAVFHCQAFVTMRSYSLVDLCFVDHNKLQQSDF